MNEPNTVISILQYLKLNQLTDDLLELETIIKEETSFSQKEEKILVFFTGDSNEWVR